MSNLKRNSIELLKEMKGDEAVMEVFWTPAFIPLGTVYEAVDLLAKYEEIEKERPLSSQEIREYMKEMCEVVANSIYKGQFTAQDLEERLHAPGAFFTLQEQILFVSSGAQSTETKKLLAKKA